MTTHIRPCFVFNLFLRDTDKIETKTSKSYVQSEFKHKIKRKSCDLMIRFLFIGTEKLELVGLCPQDSGMFHDTWCVGGILGQT